ncbi:MAG: ABC transporter substrate-binding protein [Thermomicrobiales bacterium]
MVRATRLNGTRLDRRWLLQAAGGAAALAAFGHRGFTIGASAQDAVTITMWGNHPEWRDPMLEILGAFEEVTPGVSVEFTGVPGPDYPTKLQTAVAGGAPSDVLGALEGSIITQANAGGELPFIDLTGKIDISGLTETARGQVEVDGKVYGTPLASYTVGLAYQKPIFAEHGLEPPTTWDELRTVAQALLDAGETPLVVGAKDGVHPYFMYIGLVSSILGPEGFAQLRRGERMLTDPDLVEAAQLLLDLQPFYQSGFQATDYVTAKAIFANAQGAMEVAGTADFTGYREVNPEADLGFIAWPGPEAGKYSTNTGMELLYTVSRFGAPEVQEAATRFVGWLATEQAQQLVSDTIALPVHTGITESSDPIRQETVAARGLDVIVWYDLPETALTFDTVSQAQGGLWTGRLTAAQFAAEIQASITPSSGAATPTA